MAENRNIIAEWRESAPYWEKHDANVRRMFAPISEGLISAARITTGQRVLDVAGGTGEPSFEIARRVAPSGSVVCTDAALEMVAAAERKAKQQAIPNIEFKQCTADSLPFDDESFDAVVSRLGAMFFPDILAALREILRVTKPAGTLTLAVWSDRNVNPFFSIVADVLARYVPSPPEDPDAPGAFRFAEKGKLAHWLVQAGAVSVREQVLDFRMEAEMTPAGFWQFRSEISDSMRAKVAKLTADEIAQAASEVQEQAKPLFNEGHLNMPAQVIIVSGDKPA